MSLVHKFLRHHISSTGEITSIPTHVIHEKGAPSTEPPKRLLEAFRERELHLETELTRERQAGQALKQRVVTLESAMGALQQEHESLVRRHNLREAELASRIRDLHVLIGAAEEALRVHGVTIPDPTAATAAGSANESLLAQAKARRG